MKMVNNDLYSGYEAICEVDEEVYDGDTEKLGCTDSIDMHLYRNGDLPRLAAEKASSLQEAAKSVCRLYAFYSNDQSLDFDYPNYRIQCGTAFSVSPSLLMTSSGLVSAVMQPNLSLHKVFVTFCEDGRRPVDELENLYGFHEVMVQQSDSVEWCFLKLVDHTCSSFLLPASEESRECALIGYPGILDSKTYDRHHVGCGMSHTDLVRLVGGFHRKIVSLGRIVRQEDNRLHHSCSAMRGMSGSPLINMEGKWIGMQLGGTEQHNVAMIGVTMPNDLRVRRIEQMTQTETDDQLAAHAAEHWYQMDS